MRSTPILVATLLTSTLLAAAGPAGAQDFPTDDPVIRAIWNQGMVPGNSRVEWIAQRLTDSIGPRLSGSSGQRDAIAWSSRVIESWGVPVELHEYGTWTGWERGITHLDLIEPRVRSLNGMMLSYSLGTDGPVEGEIVAMPTFRNPEEFDAWLPTAAGRFVAMDQAEPTCRAPESWETYATEESWQRMQERQQEVATRDRMSRTAIGGTAAVQDALARAGALGILTTNWSEGWGANKIFDADTRLAPVFHLSCEDYGLVNRLASNDQGPVLRANAEAEFTGEQPVANVLGTLRGTEMGDEFVFLTGHLDSWDGAAGATDNGSGVTIMMEAMRILSEVYPNPKRTIVLALWGGEEQGLIGSNAYAEDHPEVVENLQAAFNQDNGTWRIDFVRMQGYVGAGEHWGRWFSAIPNEITDHIELDIPGVPETGGSDHMAFICRGAAGFRLQSNYPDYRQYTWHTDLDTYDKLVMDDLRNNATLAAMLAYLASEDPERVGTEQRDMERGWPGCRRAERSGG